MIYRNFLIIFLFCIFSNVEGNAQEKPGYSSSQPDSTGSALFDSEDILHFKLAGNINEIYKDISDNNSYHPMLLQYMAKDSNEVSIQIKVKTRGHFRRVKGNCTQPPLWLEFPKGDKIKNTEFENQHKLKLVVPCRGDEYVIYEYLVYKVYNLISQNSFKARLALVEFEDSLHQRKTETHYCFLLEEENKMAARNGRFVYKKQKLDDTNTDLEAYRKMAVFEYLIGNTDWGVYFLQNIVLITKDTLMRPIPVPYDYDHAGIVDAPYAGPAPDLGISSILERLYRGFCENDIKNLDATFALYNRMKPAIYQVYDSCTLISAKYKKFVDRYLDDFYKTINNKNKIESEFGAPCRADTRVIIKGLKN